MPGQGSLGLTGATGAKGATGARGATGATGARGSTAYVGVWSNAVAYNDGDIVKYGPSNDLRMYQLICPLMGIAFQACPPRIFCGLTRVSVRGSTGAQGIQVYKGKGDAARATYQGAWHENRVDIPPTMKEI